MKRSLGPRLPSLLLAVAACQHPSGADPKRDHGLAETAPEGETSAGETDDTPDESGDDTASSGFVLRADPAVALPFATAGEAVADETLEIRAEGDSGSEGALTFTIDGDFAIDGDESPLAAGETRRWTVSYTGPTADALIATGTATITADGQSAVVALAAVLGDPDLPDATWTDDAWGSHTIVPLPSAPYPYGSASYTDSSVLIAVPTSFTDQGDIGVITHIHGHNAILADVVAAQYLVEQHSLSGRDAILVVPQGPYNVASGNFGRLMTDGAHANLIRDAVSVLYRDGYLMRPTLGAEVVSSHSGGYLCTSAILQQGGLPIDAVHLFDSLYGEVSVFRGWIEDGGLFRSVYTSSGGTDDNNRSLASTLEGEGLTVSEDFGDDALASGNLTIGYSDATHSGTVWYGRAYARWLAESGLRRSPLAPPELRAVISDGTTATVSWRADRSPPDSRLTIEGSEDGETWTVLDTVEDPAGDGENLARVPAHPWIRARGADDTYGEPAPSDRYGGSGKTWLVVDGFDRVLGGSWSLPTHDFAARLGVALGEPFSTASDEAVEAGDVDLSDYAGVLWFLGDESLADQTFSEAQEAAISAYVEGGGALIVSGSELGYASDATWLSDTLHATYVSDDAGTDVAGDYTFGVTYDEDYPDVLRGSTTIWSYDTGSAAAVGWNHQVVAVGFTLETMDDADLSAALPELVGWLGL